MVGNEEELKEIILKEFHASAFWGWGWGGAFKNRSHEEENQRFFLLEGAQGVSENIYPCMRSLSEVSK